MDEAATRALVQSRAEAIRAIIARRGAVQALKRAGVVIEALQGIVVKGVASGAISLPQTPEELARLLNRWIMAAHEATGQVALEEAHEAIRLEGETRALNRQLSDAGAENVIPFPTPPAPPAQEPAPRGRVRRRKKA